MGEDGHVRIDGHGFAELAGPTTMNGITRKADSGVSWYSAPELLVEGAHPNYASDVWAFGCVCLLVSNADIKLDHQSVLSFRLPRILKRRGLVLRFGPVMARSARHRTCSN